MAVSIDDDIRVLYVIGGRRIGGMEIHLVTLARRLPASIRCLVCCLDASAEYRALLTEAGIEHANLDCPMLVRPRSLLAFRRFRHVVKGFRPHIVHSYGFSGDVIAAALRASGVNVRVITSRRSEDRNARHQATRRLVDRVLKPDRMRVGRDRELRHVDRMAAGVPASRSFRTASHPIPRRSLPALLAIAASQSGSERWVPSSPSRGPICQSRRSCSSRPRIGSSSSSPD